MIFAESFDYNGLGIPIPYMTLSEIYKGMDQGQNLSQILFDLDVKDYDMEESN